MAKLIFQYLAIYVQKRKFAQLHIFNQSRFKIWPNIKLTLKSFPKLLKFRKSGKNYTNSGHTVSNPAAISVTEGVLMSEISIVTLHNTTKFFDQKFFCFCLKPFRF